MAWAPGGSIPSGRPGGFPVGIRTQHQMIDRGLHRLSPGKATLKVGYVSARGTADIEVPESAPGRPGYMPHQPAMLIGTDIRNFSRSSVATSAKVK